MKKEMMHDDKPCRSTSVRREFLRDSTITLMGASLGPWNHILAQGPKEMLPEIKPCGPASTYIPKVRAAFVRRQGDYGILWPGAIYDGEAARRMYTEKITAAAKAMNVRLELKDLPIYSLEEAKAWIQSAQADSVDGLLVMVLDRQQHAWPTARLAAESGLPTVIYSPLGTSFTTNTGPLADLPRCVIYSTNDFRQAIFGLKMLKAGSRLKRSRALVIAGEVRNQVTLADTGITLQYIPAGRFLEEYRKMPVTSEVTAMAEEYVSSAREQRGATRQDVIHGIKSYLVAGRFLQEEKADAITMDCLGALGKTEVSLPCIAWSRMNDVGIPAACEADLGALATHMIVQYLFDRPGFQQDPVADTSDDTLIGAHCSSPTRLNGIQLPPEPFHLVHHHGNRDAVPRTLWKIGQRITCLILQPADMKKQIQSKILISVGSVMENMEAPPSGGCVVSVKVKMDGKQRVLDFPGFHQLFFYGDYQREMVDFCRLQNFQAQIV